MEPGEVKAVEPEKTLPVKKILLFKSISNNFLNQAKN